MGTSNGSTKQNIKVVKTPDQRLRVKTKPIKKITPALVDISRQMIKLTKSFLDPEGVGLASTQIGREERFFIMKDRENGDFIVCFNPKIISYGKKKKTFFEGCLSIPDYYGHTVRPTTISVEYQDERGELVKRKLVGLSAWIFQHEMDHLNGTLFMDHVFSQKGKIFKVKGKDKTGSDIFEEVRLI